MSGGAPTDYTPTPGPGQGTGAVRAEEELRRVKRGRTSDVLTPRRVSGGPWGRTPPPRLHGEWPSTRRRPRGKTWPRGRRRSDGPPTKNLKKNGNQARRKRKDTKKKNPNPLKTSFSSQPKSRVRRGRAGVVSHSSPSVVPTSPTPRVHGPTLPSWSVRSPDGPVRVRSGPGRLRPRQRPTAVRGFVGPLVRGGWSLGTSRLVTPVV